MEKPLGGVSPTLNILESWFGPHNAAGTVTFVTCRHAHPFHFAVDIPPVTSLIKSRLNNAVILQFLEQSFHGRLHYHDRWNGK
jgi:hypothetical protein